MSGWELQHLIGVIFEGDTFALKVKLLDTNWTCCLSLLADTKTGSTGSLIFHLHTLPLSTWRAGRAAASSNTSGNSDLWGRAWGQLQPGEENKLDLIKYSLGVVCQILNSQCKLETFSRCGGPKGKIFVPT